MVHPLYALLKPSKPDPINSGGQDDTASDTASEQLLKSLLRSPALGQSHYQLPFFPYMCEKERNAHRMLTPKQGNCQ